MTHVAAIELENYGPFRGRHELRPGPGVHAVTARGERDETLSNWFGKSWLLGAVPFALFAKLPPGCRVREDWITRGEQGGAVAVRLSDGIVARRTQTRGDSLQLEVEYLEASVYKVARGFEAERKLAAAVGLSADNFFTLAFMRQKAADGMVRAKPGDLYAAASSWFDLDRLDDGASRIASSLEVLVGERDTLARRAADLAAVEGAEEVADVDALLTRLAAATAAAKELQVELDEFSDWMVRSEHAAEYEACVASARAIKAEAVALEPKRLAKRLTVLKGEAATASAALAVAKVQADDRTRLAVSGFSGACPVTNQACPAAPEVSAWVAHRSDLADASSQAERAARAKSDAVHQHLAECEAGLRKADHLRVRFDALEKRAAQLADDHAEVAGVGDPDEGMQDVRERCREAWDACAGIEKEIEFAIRAAAKRAERARDAADVARRIAALDSRVAVHSAGAAIFGRRGAQRTIARGGLADIEREANAALAEAGLDLSVEVEWEREAGGLAAACESCGFPFPKTQKVKECGRCGGPRGPKVVQELRLQPSATSGAAEDLVGVWFQLAASAWRRRRLGAQWSAAFLDEPFAHVDEGRRRSVAAHLVEMLPRFGFDQAFVTAHDRGVLDTMPGRIVVVGGQDRSWIES